MDRRQKLLEGLAVATSLGAEIGALCRPFVTREDGRVLYVDHASTEDLKFKYRIDPDVPQEAIVEVDAVWGGQSLLEALGTKVDYIVASHVVEHVPDLI